MHDIDLCIAWNWEYDQNFVNQLESVCRAAGLSVLQVSPENLEIMLESLGAGNLSYRVFWDRASEDDERYMPFVRWALANSSFYINRHDRASRSWNKASMHYELIRAGVYTPYTIVIPAYADQPVIPEIDITKVGTPYILKPVHGSGGEDVFLDVLSPEQILALRRKNPERSYLVQKYIAPLQLDSRPAWFRVLFCNGIVYRCWWHPETHIYLPVNETEEIQFGLGQLSVIAGIIAGVTGLDLFSTEIAYTPENLFVAVDYVNDQPDLRKQSNAADGVPDPIVDDIVQQLATLVQVKNR